MRAILRTVEVVMTLKGYDWERLRKLSTPPTLVSRVEEHRNIATIFTDRPVPDLVMNTNLGAIELRPFGLRASEHTHHVARQFIRRYQRY